MIPSRGTGDLRSVASHATTPQREPIGEHATIVGRVVRDHTGLVTLETPMGTERIVDMLPGDQLPRIC